MELGGRVVPASAAPPSSRRHEGAAQGVRGMRGAAGAGGAGRAGSLGSLGCCIWVLVVVPRFVKVGSNVASRRLHRPRRAAAVPFIHSVDEVASLPGSFWELESAFNAMPLPPQGDVAGWNAQEMAGGRSHRRAHAGVPVQVCWAGGVRRASRPGESGQCRRRGGLPGGAERVGTGSARCSSGLKGSAVP